MWVLLVVLQCGHCNFIVFLHCTLYCNVDAARCISMCSATSLYCTRLLARADQLHCNCKAGWSLHCLVGLKQGGVPPLFICKKIKKTILQRISERKQIWKKLHWLVGLKQGGVPALSICTLSSDHFDFSHQTTLMGDQVQNKYEVQLLSSDHWEGSRGKHWKSKRSLWGTAQFSGSTLVVYPQ